MSDRQTILLLALLIVLALPPWSRAAPTPGSVTFEKRVLNEE